MWTGLREPTKNEILRLATAESRYHSMSEGTNGGICFCSPVRVGAVGEGLPGQC